MNELIEFLTSKEIIVVYIVAAVACALCFIIYLIDKTYYKRKQRHNTMELNKLVEEVNYTQDAPLLNNPSYDVPVIEPVVEEKKAATEEVLTPITENAMEEKPSLAEPTPIIADTKVEPVMIEEDIKEIESSPVESLVLDTMVEELDLDASPKASEELIKELKPEEELSYTSVEPNRLEARQELLRLTEELEQAEQESKNIDLTAYEEEQEENAIISLDELMKKSKELYESNEYTQYVDEGNEPISLADLERRMNEVQKAVTEIEDSPVIVETITAPVESVSVGEPIEEPKMVLDDLNTITSKLEVQPEPVKPLSAAYSSVKKFERSPVISPIYGIEKKETTQDMELENTANYEKLDEEIRKTNEFLMTLRELQKNLD